MDRLRAPLTIHHSPESFTPMRILRSTTLAALALAAAPSLAQQAPAQQAPAQPAAGQQAAALRAAPSARATAVASLSTPRVQGQPAPTPLTIRIDYGQPFARGRKVVGGLIPMDTVWRTGANAATSLTTDVDLTIGGTRVPKGSYTLFTHQSASGWQLIVSKKTGQWGTQYDAKEDLARIPLKASAAAAPLEAFTIWLVPSGDGSPRGELRMAWGDVVLSADWALAQ